MSCFAFAECKGAEKQGAMSVATSHRAADARGRRLPRHCEVVGTDAAAGIVDTDDLRSCQSCHTL